MLQAGIVKWGDSGVGVRGLGSRCAMLYDKKLLGLGESKSSGLRVSVFKVLEGFGVSSFGAWGFKKPKFSLWAWGIQVSALGSRPSMEPT